MAYRPRTPEDANRLREAVAQNPQIITETGSFQPPPAPGMRLATEADVPALGGITVDDIRRMMSSPARYGPIYAREQGSSAKGAQSAPSAPKPAVDNAKRTKTKEGPDKRPKGTPLPPKRPEEEKEGFFSGVPWWLALAGLRKRPGDVGPEGKGGLPAVRGKAGLPVATDAADAIIEDAIWSPAGTLPKTPRNPLVEGPGRPLVDPVVGDPMGTGAAEIAAPVKLLPAPPGSPEAPRATGDVIQAPDKTPEKTVTDIIKEAQAGAKTKKGKNRKKMPPGSLEDYRYRVKNPVKKIRMKTLKLYDGSEVALTQKEVAGDEFIPAPPADIRLEDLPADARMMNVVCAVLAYSFIGIRQQDIALALGCSEQELTNILESEAYSKSYQMVLTSFVKGQQNAARDVISANAVHAAHELVRTMRASKSESNRLRASEGVLNRAGVSDTGSLDNMSDGLVIRVVKDTKTDIHIKVG